MHTYNKMLILLRSLAKQPLCPSLKFELLLVVPCCSNAAAAANFMPQSHSSNAVNLLMTTLSGFWNVLQGATIWGLCSESKLLGR